MLLIGRGRRLIGCVGYERWVRGGKLELLDQGQVFMGWAMEWLLSCWLLLAL